MNILKSIFGGEQDDSARARRAGVVTAAQAKAGIDSENSPYILDVREPEEFHSGHIAGATLIPLGQLHQHMDELPKDKTILCVCASGSRSSAAAGQLARAGYKSINLSGGMMGWQIAGFPVTRGK